MNHIDGTPMTIEEIKQAIHEFEIMFYNYIYVNPTDAENVRKIVKDMERYKVVESVFVEQGKAIIVNPNDYRHMFGEVKL